MSKKMIRNIIIILVALGIGYFSYKYAVLTLGSDERDVSINNLNINIVETMTINKAIPDNYINYGNIKIGNFFEEFERQPERESGFTYVLNNPEGENSVGLVFYATLPTLVDSFINQSYRSGSEYFLHNLINGINPTKILESQNINTDIELVRFINENKNSEINIFSSLRRIKETNAFNQFFLNWLAMYESIAQIKGDFDGYILRTTSAKEVIIIDNNQRYIFNFVGLDYFTDDLVRDIISTLEFIN